MRSNIALSRLDSITAKSRRTSSSVKNLMVSVRGELRLGERESFFFIFKQGY
jgi:hypothetical protein